MRKRGKSDRPRERFVAARAPLTAGFAMVLLLLLVLSGACGGTSSETPYPREPVPDDPLAAPTGGQASS